MDLLWLANEVASRIAARAVGAGARVAITIFDRDGEIVLQHRMDGAAIHAVALSERKAYTAALVGMRTDQLGAPGGDAPDYSPTAVGGGRFCVIGGGAPLTVGGVSFGGVGVSGAEPGLDAALIDAALQETGALRIFRGST